MTTALDKVAVWTAQGLGVGRLPAGPGTWGSLVGLGWFALLLVPGSPWIYLLGTLLGIALAVGTCSRAERVLGTHDPGSVVLDEIAAVPVCFGSLLAVQTVRHGFPDPTGFLHTWSPWILVAGFVAFRVFDILKPWPVGRAQGLPGGWGIVADDVLAALWVAVLGLGWAWVFG